MKVAAGTAVSRHDETLHAPDETTPVVGDAGPAKPQAKTAPAVTDKTTPAVTEKKPAGATATSAAADRVARIPAMANKTVAPARKVGAVDEIDDVEDSEPDADDEPEAVAAAEPAEEDEVEPEAAAPVAAPVPRPPQHGPMHIPRAMAKAEVFVEGDHVVYPTHGVGKVERIAIEEIAGHKLELIHITFEENRMTLRVPVAKARTAGLRKLATRKMFDEALAVLKGRARIKRTMWSRRAQEYEAKINSGDPLAIAEVVRDLHRNAGQPDQSFSERQIYEAAMDRLAAELAALDKTDKSAAVTKLAEFLKTV
jgi:CarD family transcriptional regulator